VYNVEHYVGRCIDSVLSQSFTDWELILVDDCGIDNSMSIVKEYAARDERIKYIESIQNAGPMVAREKGYRAAQGDYIAFLDSDDIMPDNALESLISVAKETELDIVMGQMERVLDNGMHVPFEVQVHAGEKSKDEVYGLLLEGVFPHNLCGKLFNVQLFKTNSLDSFIGLKNGEDGYLFLQLLEYTNGVYVIPGIVYYYLCHKDSSSHKPISSEMINSIVKFECYRYKVLTSHLGDIDNKYSEYLHSMLSDIAIRYSYKKLEDAFNSHGLRLNFGFLNMLKFMSLKKALKVFIKSKIIGRIRASN
jgi:glycosyltransferase involved in cell wall biosynthesis